MQLSERVRVREQDALEAGGPTVPWTGCAPDLATVPPTEFCCRVCGQGCYCSVANGLPNSSASAPTIPLAGSAQAMSCGSSDMVGTSGGQSPDEMSLLTSTA